jgi:hypothetical protein
MSLKTIITLLAISLLLMIVGCSSSNSGSSSSSATTVGFVGTQTPGDYWSWSKTTDNNGSVSFTATNKTRALNYSGTESQLTGNAAGLSKLNITSSNDANITTPASAYKLEVPNTMVMAAVAPFYTFNHNGQVQLSVHAPVVAAAEGSCPSTGTTNVNWIVMPNDTWCPEASSVIASGTCSSASNAYGTAQITVSGGTYTINVTPYQLDGSAGSPVSLSSCTCSEGVIQCTDSHNNPVRIAFTPSGIFIMDTASYGVAGVVQPSSNINIADFLANGRSFKGMNFTPWDDYYDGCTSSNDCNVYGISGGTCLSGHCGIPETSPVSITADGTNLNAFQYTNIDNGLLSTAGGSVNFAGALQPSPGLITATLTAPCASTFPIVMAVNQINGKYVAFVLTHTTCPTFDSPFNVFAIEQ